MFRRRSMKCMLMIGVLGMGLIALLLSGRRFSVDIRVTSMQPDAGILLSSAALPSGLSREPSADGPQLQTRAALAEVAEERSPGRPAPVVQPAHRPDFELEVEDQEGVRPAPPPAPAEPELAEPELEEAAAPEAPFEEEGEPSAPAEPAHVIPPQPKCSYTKTEGGGQTSRHGKPCLPPARRWPYVGYTPWRQALGERIVAAVSGTVVEEDCRRFTAFADYTWCVGALGGKRSLGLSSGNHDKDEWSERMVRSNRVPTRYYNCFRDPDAENTDELDTPYQVQQTCLGPEENDFDGRSYTALAAELEGRDQLSVHLNLNTEVSGWTTLQQVVEDAAIRGKLRTLDVDVHIANRASFDADFDGLSEQDLLEKQIGILETLLKHFKVTGSTLEVYRQGWNPEQDCPEQQCGEPAVYTAGGFPPRRVAVSYVKRELLAVSGAPVAGGADDDEGLDAAPGAGSDTGSDTAEEEAPARPAPGPATSKWPSRAGCTYKLPNQVSSRPGPPCIAPAKIWPWVTNTPWRTDIGERIVNAVTPTITEEECGGWHMFGDQTWCNNAMKRKDVIGLSYGIEERDLYSEYLSNHYHLPTKLFDCFIEPEKSPPIAGTAPNAEGPCTDSSHCYETAYESFRVCLGPEKGEIDGRSYDTLASALADRGPLSTHVKIDVEGSEWTVLEHLLKSSADQGKIRTLDMEIHFGFQAASEANLGITEKQRLEREVGIIEGLHKHFRVTGSTLEVYRQGWFPEKDCPEQQCHEPVVHTAGGYSPQMFAVSFVNRALVLSKDGAAGGGADEDIGTQQTESVAEEPAPAPVPRKQKTKKATDVREKPPVLPNPKPCKYVLPNQVSSRPGPPCIPPAKYWPYVSNTPWRERLGNRIVEAVTPIVSEEQCGGWHMFGDQTWCNKAMKKKDVLALSFGIEERDLFSEYMSNTYHVKTKLFDCFIEPEKSPPIAGTAPNATKKCKGVSGHCYETPYESYRICLGPEATEIDGRQYDSLAKTLEGRPPLSTHVKIDVEGSEWTVLENLLKSEADMAKIRTLDMEIHFGFRAVSEAAYDDFPEEERILRQIKIIEGLRKRFFCTGSTLEVYRQGWFPEKDCNRQQCHEPVVHTTGGFSPQMFAVSYVNKQIVDPDGLIKEEGVAAAPPAAAQREEATEAPAPTPAPMPIAPRAPAQAPAARTCKYVHASAQSSRPGPPCIPPSKRWPYRGRTEWRVTLGERIVRAVTPYVTEKECGGWIMWGDQTWCKKAFGKDKVIGLSFGIEERDMYSEYLSNNFHVPTKLYDCFQNPKQSPPLSGKAPNATGPCRGGEHCYETQYQSFRVCLGPKKGEVEGRKYDTLSNHLKDVGPLGAHVKIDVEGSEWTVLEDLIANDEDQDKIRTLDMEIHFGFQAASEIAYRKWSEQKRIAREIKIIEGLHKRFYVTGTTLEVYRQGWLPDQDCPKQQCEEPRVYTAGGFSPQMFALSFVNKKLVGPVAGHDILDDPPAATAAAGGGGEAAGSEVEEESELEEERSVSRPVQPVGNPATEYGFYMHVYQAPAAVIHQVRQIKKHFPGSPIYIMSDGGWSFDGLCEQEGCKFVLCPPANDRWHPWPFLHRLVDAAEWLKTKYVIMLEPDNTIHGPIKRPPKADAGGVPVRDRIFGERAYIEKLAQERKPGFRWTDEAMKGGLAGGAYFKTEAIMDAFSDERIAALDWNRIIERTTKEIYSSDFAMQYALAARGWEIEPWMDCAQMDRSKDKPISGAKDSAFRHYCSCYPGGKPTYNLQVKPGDGKLFTEPTAKYNRLNSNCQMCYNLTKYIQDWGSAKCTNPIPVAYSEKILKKHFPDGKYPYMGI